MGRLCRSCGYQKWKGKLFTMMKHSQLEWERKFFTMGRCCYYCGVPLTLKQATKDHMQPRTRGGSDDLLNIVPACWPCNRRKNTMTAEEFRSKFSTICTASTVNSSLKSDSVTLCYEEKNEPGLLKRVVSERNAIRWWRTA